MLGSVGAAQILTLVIPLGFFILALIWGFFQREPRR